MANIISDKYKKIDVKGRDYPLLKGDIRLELKNVHNGKTEVIEDHNMITNALSDIFTNNYGGLINYNNFANLYKTWLGGVLLFGSQLDLTSASDYGIPSQSTHTCPAHAGQTILSDQADDLTRGNPDSQGTVLSANSTKLCWEWGTSAGNGTIASLGLTHTDTGSYGCGIVSTAQRSLVPFVDVACSSQSYSYGDNANCALGIYGNIAYNFYLVDSTTVHIYKTPINNSKFKLQGTSLEPITTYSQMITATLPNSYEIAGKGDCYYWFDFANNALVLFGVPTNGGTTLYRDDISLADGTVTHSSITVTGAQLWKFRIKTSGFTPYPGHGYHYMAVPTPAMICNGCIYLYGYATNDYCIDKMYKVNLSQTQDIDEVDVTTFRKADLTTQQTFTARAHEEGWTMTTGRCAIIGDTIVTNSYIVTGDKVYATSQLTTDAYKNYNLSMLNSISSPAFGLGVSINKIAVCKLYLATKYNLPSAVTKTSAQSMRVEYTLTEV